MTKVYLILAFFLLNTFTTRAKGAISNAFIESNNECGGVLDGLGGAINYKLNQQYNPNSENCVWTVRTELKKNIELQLLDDGFNNGNNPAIHISISNPSTKFYSEKVLTLQKGDRNVYNISGPLMYVQFVTRPDLNEGGTGFSLLFRGYGDDWENPVGGFNDTYKYVMEHVNASDGSMHFPTTPGAALRRFEVFSLSLVPVKDHHLEVTVMAPISLGYDFPAVGYFMGCMDYRSSNLILTEHEYWAGPSPRLTICRPEPTHNSTVVSPHPLVLTFYSHTAGKDGFVVHWESAPR